MKTPRSFSRALGVELDPERLGVAVAVAHVP